MKMTTRGRYAVTAMLDLALRYGQAPTPLADIADRQNISLSYLEQLFAQLRRDGLVNSTRGPGGGYTLNCPPTDITVSAIVRAVNETFRGAGTTDDPCYLSQIWDELSADIEQFLDSVSLASILNSSEVKDIAERQHRIFSEKQQLSV